MGSFLYEIAPEYIAGIQNSILFPYIAIASQSMQDYAKRIVEILSMLNTFSPI